MRREHKFAWLLGFCLVGGLLLASAAGAREFRKANFAQELDPEEVLALLIEGGGPLIVDTRPWRRYDAGHVPGALNVHTKEIWGWIPDFEKYEERGIIFYCDNGLNSGTASRKLLKEGFRKVFVMRGYFGRWKQLGLPVEVSEDR